MKHRNLLDIVHIPLTNKRVVMDNNQMVKNNTAVIMTLDVLEYSV